MGQLHRLNSELENQTSCSSHIIFILTPNIFFVLTKAFSLFFFFLSMALIGALFSQMNRTYNTIYINKFLPPPGCEPGSLGTVSRWLIHYATVPHPFHFHCYIGTLFYCDQTNTIFFTFLRTINKPPFIKSLFLKNSIKIIHKGLNETVSFLYIDRVRLKPPLKNFK